MTKFSRRVLLENIIYLNISAKFPIKKLFYVSFFFLNLNLHSNNLHIFMGCQSDMLVYVSCVGALALLLF